jgi:hypothetical protein
MSDYFDTVRSQLSQLTRDGVGHRRHRFARTGHGIGRSVRATPRSIRIAMSAAVCITTVLAVVVFSGAHRLTSHRGPADPLIARSQTFTVHVMPVSDITSFKHATWKVAVARGPIAGSQSVRLSAHVSISATHVPALEHAAYGVWLIGARGTADDFLGFVAANPRHGRFTAVGGITRHGSFRALELTIETGQKPTTPGRVVLRGELDFRI